MRCQHCGDEDAIGSTAVGERIDLPFVRCVEERNHDRRLPVLMDVHSAGVVDVAKLSLRLICLD